MKILYINACVRKDSRTRKLADHLLSKLGDNDVHELVLKDENLQVLSDKKLELRDSLLKQKKFDDSLFNYANEFAKADIIVMAAPYWDLSMPAFLKMYIELIDVVGITFDYDENEKSYGLCKAKKLYYVSTMGGKDLPYTYGYEYVKELCDQFYGIQETVHFKAEGLDLLNAEPDKIMKKAMEDIDRYFENDV